MGASGSTLDWSRHEFQRVIDRAASRPSSDNVVIDHNLAITTSATSQAPAAPNLESNEHSIHSSTTPDARVSVASRHISPTSRLLDNKDDIQPATDPVETVPMHVSDAYPETGILQGEVPDTKFDDGYKPTPSPSSLHSGIERASISSLEIPSPIDSPSGPDSVLASTTDNVEIRYGENSPSEASNVVQSDYHSHNSNFLETNSSVLVMQDAPNHSYRATLDHLQDSRYAALAARMKNRERRNELRYLRETLVENDTHLLELLRQSRVSQSLQNSDELARLIESSISTRQELIHLESEYNSYEDQLDRQEWELKEAERSAYIPKSPVPRDQSLPSRVANRTSTDNDDGDTYGHSGRSSSDRVWMSTWESHLNNRLLSRQGDGYLIEEELYELRAERAHLVDLERARADLGLKLDEEGQDFLRNFDTKHAELQEELKQIQQDLFEIQETINYQSNDLFRVGQFTDLPAQDFPGSDLEEWSSDLQGDGTIIIHSKMILDHGEDDPKFDKVVHQGFSTSARMRCFINQWLLIDLRRSRLQWLILQTYLREEPALILLTESELADAVLEHWNHDGTEPRKNDSSITDGLGGTANANLATDTYGIAATPDALHTIRSQRSDSAFRVRAGWGFTQGKDAREPSKAAGLKIRAKQLVSEYFRPKARSVS